MTLAAVRNIPAKPGLLRQPTLPLKYLDKTESPPGSAGEAVAVCHLLEYLAIGGASTGVIPAQAGLRRQDAEANSEAGPEGTPQERRVIHFALDGASNQIKMDPLSRG
jgi:hypothetical protein